MPARPRRRRLARLFAPLALLACTGALVAVVFSSSLVKGDEGDGGERTTERTSTGKTDTNERPRRRTRARYRIKTGDTLGAIAEETGVPVERIEELNPELDPQALVAGQRIRLRE
jgi:LysM repeat protein